jgi:hypothetical protein
MVPAPVLGTPFDPPPKICYNRLVALSLSNHDEPKQEQARMSEIEETTPVQDGRTPANATPAEAAATEEGQGRSAWQTMGIILGVLVFVIVISALFYGLMTHPVFTAGLRDVAIIVLALVTMITSVLLAVLLFQLQSLIVLLRDEIQPILQSINQTTGTVRGTATFVSDAVVSPMIEVAGYVSGVQKAFKTLFGGSGEQRASSQAVGREPEATKSEPVGSVQDSGEPTQ